MTLQKRLLLIYWWARDYPLTDAAEEAEIDAGRAMDVFQWFREVCSTKLLQTPLVLGGAGVVVQVDKSLFRHKPRVYYCPSLMPGASLVPMPWEGITSSMGRKF